MKPWINIGFLMYLFAFIFCGKLFQGLTNCNNKWAEKRQEQQLQKSSNCFRVMRGGVSEVSGGLGGFSGISYGAFWGALWELGSSPCGLWGFGGIWSQMQRVQHVCRMQALASLFSMCVVKQRISPETFVTCALPFARHPEALPPSLRRLCDALRTSHAIACRRSRLLAEPWPTYFLEKIIPGINFWRSQVRIWRPSGSFFGRMVSEGSQRAFWYDLGSILQGFGFHSGRSWA